MRQFIGRTLFKGLAVLVGILVISTVLQLAIRIHGQEAFSELIGGQMTEGYAYPAPGRDGVITGEELDNINEFLGPGRPFVPDFWPFDNESCWHETEQEEK